MKDCVLNEIDFFVLIIILKFNRNIMKLIHKNLFKFFKSLFVYLDFCLILSKYCSSFLPLNMKCVFQSYFLSPTNVYQNTDTCNYHNYSANNDDKFP